MISMQLAALIPSVLLLIVGAGPRRLVNRLHKSLIRGVVLLTALQSSLAVVSLALSLLGVGPGTAEAASLASGLPASLSGWVASELSFQLNAVAWVMLALVSFIGWVVACYSRRYLTGDPNQGNYYRWVAFTVGAVCLMSVAGSLALFAICWCFASLGMHHLLLHYHDRRGAVSAAWTKFAFSRAGDLSLIVALCIAFSELGTSQFSVLNGLQSSAGQGSLGPSLSLLFTWLIVLAACLKSAQFPFHSWLPQTIETPTPVSALMHAGIVNAGGYLLIRLSPFLVGHSEPLLCLALVGTLTAVIGAVVMSTQSSIKSSLAYSTVAQMGFMMLQCGLGAFSAAFLHIVAHSLYKAYAFLGSGSILRQQQGMRVEDPPAVFPGRASQSSGVSVSWAALGIAAVTTVCLFSIALQLFGLHPSEKTAGWLLSWVVCLALVSAVWRAMRSGDSKALIASLVMAAILSCTYAGSFWLSEKIVGPAAPPTTAGSVLVSCVAAAAFLLLFVCQSFLRWPPESQGATARWKAKFYVHAVNGFYIGTVWKRLLGLNSTANSRSFAGLN